MIRRSVVALAVAAILGASPLASNLGDVLQRASVYVVNFERELAGVVAEESYHQITTPTGRELELRSDLLMVKPVGGDHYVGFRDVFEANRRPVRDREDRLLHLFLAPDATTRSQAQAIADDSARFNVGGVTRNVNVPTFALTILEPQNHSRFVFKEGRGSPELLEADQKGTGTVIAFEERDHPTLIRTVAGKDAPTHGRVWLEPLTGRVLVTEMVTESPSVPVGTMIEAVIDVEYRAEPGLPVSVPGEMRERYQVRDGSHRPSEQIEGRALYSHFRQFQVAVDEKFAPIKR